MEKGHGRKRFRQTANVNSLSDDRDLPFIAPGYLHAKIYHSKQTIVRFRREVRLVIRKQDNPPDDIGPVLTKILTGIIRNLPGHRHVRVTGFSITPGPAVPPVVFRLMGEDDRRRLPFETIESEDFIFITARLPIHLISTPHVEIMQDAIHIFIDERVASILLQSPVDASRSHYTVLHGILDITLTKIRKT